MEKPKTISEQMAEFTLGLTYKDIPKDVIDHGKLLLTDTFGVAMACQDAGACKSSQKDSPGNEFPEGMQLVGNR